MLIAGIFVLSLSALVLILIFLQRRRKLQGPINAKEENQLPVKTRKPEEFVALTYCYLAAWVIGKNARDTQEKIAFAVRYLKQRFEKPEAELTDELIAAIRNSTNIRNVAAWVVRHLKDINQRIALLDFLIELSFSDSDIIDREYVSIARFAELIGIRTRYVADEIHKRRKAIYDEYKGDEAVDLVANGTFFRRRALFRLGLTESATQNEIRKAYRQLASQFHPDKFEQAEEHERQQAAEKFMEIKEAYHFLRK